jgi:hypothetical protein
VPKGNFFIKKTGKKREKKKNTLGVLKEEREKNAST